ncbi:MAG: addiction module protein [Pyrinomonadaceae bacterium]
MSRNEHDFESPGWHEVVLKEREERLMKGEETPLDWEKAKEALRDRLSL